MARRGKTERIMTPVQGDDAWVIVTLPSVGEVEDVLAAGDDVYKSFSVGKDILRQHIREWNWVDYDDSPLPCPSEDPEVVNGLTLEEYMALIRILLGDEEDRKN